MSYQSLFHDPPPIKEAKLGKDRLESLDRRSLWRENFQGETVVTVCASVGNTNMLSWLIETFNVDVNTRNRDGRSLLSLAAENGHANVVKLLLSLDCDIAEDNNRKNMTPLDHAAKNGHDCVIQALVHRYERKSVEKALSTALARNHLTACLAFHEYDPTLVIDVAMASDDPYSPFKPPRAFTNNDCLLWYLSELMRHPPAAESLWKADISSACCRWSPSTVEQVEKMTLNCFALPHSYNVANFWTDVVRTNNVALIMWAYQMRGVRPHASDRWELLRDALTYEHIDIANYVFYPHGFDEDVKFDYYGDEKRAREDDEKVTKSKVPMMPIHPPDMDSEDYVYDAANGGKESLEWLFAYEQKGNGLITMLGAMDAGQILESHVSTFRWMMENDWERVSQHTFCVDKVKELRALSLDVYWWPIGLSASETLETLKLWSGLFKWTRKELEKMAAKPFVWRGLKRRSDFYGLRVPPLIWATVFRFPKVFEWLSVDMEVDWNSLGEDAAGVLYMASTLYIDEFGDTPDPDRFEIVPMLRFLYYAVRIPLPTHPDDFDMIHGGRELWAPERERSLDFVELISSSPPHNFNSIRWFLEVYIGADWLRMCQSCDSYFGAPHPREIHPHIGTCLSPIDRSKEIQHIHHHLEDATIKPVTEFAAHLFRSFIADGRLELMQFCYKTIANNEVYSTFRFTLDEHAIASCKLDNGIRAAVPYFASKIVEAPRLFKLGVEFWLEVALMKGETSIAEWLVDEFGVSLKNPVSLLFSRRDLRALAIRGPPEDFELLKSMKWLRRRGANLNAVELRRDGTYASVLTCSAHCDAVLCFQYLLKHGADLYQECSGKTAHELAANSPLCAAFLVQTQDATRNLVSIYDPF